MGKGEGKSMNPADKLRREQRAKELKKNKERREQTRTDIVARMTISELEKQIKILSDSKTEGTASGKQLQLLRLMNERVEELRKEEAAKPAKPKSLEEMYPDAEGSIYYHPIHNPYGVPPPGHLPMWKPGYIPIAQRKFLPITHPLHPDYKHPTTETMETDSRATNLEQVADSEQSLAEYEDEEESNKMMEDELAEIPPPPEEPDSDGENPPPPPPTTDDVLPNIVYYDEEEDINQFDDDDMVVIFDEDEEQNNEQDVKIPEIPAAQKRPSRPHRRDPSLPNGRNARPPQPPFMNQPPFPIGFPPFLQPPPPGMFPTGLPPPPFLPPNVMHQLQGMSQHQFRDNQPAHPQSAMEISNIHTDSQSTASSIQDQQLLSSTAEVSSSAKNTYTLIPAALRAKRAGIQISSNPLSRPSAPRPAAARSNMDASISNQAKIETSQPSSLSQAPKSSSESKDEAYEQFMSDIKKMGVV